MVFTERKRIVQLIAPEGEDRLTRFASAMRKINEFSRDVKLLGCAASDVEFYGDGLVLQQDMDSGGFLISTHNGTHIGESIIDRGFIYGIISAVVRNPLERRRTLDGIESGDEVILTPNLNSVINR